MQILGRFSRRQKVIGGSLAGLLLLSIGLVVSQTGTRQPVANPTVIIRKTKDLPADPWAASWKRVSGVVMPLSVVSTVNPIQQNVQVKAVTDGQQVAIRLEWADDSEEAQTMRPQDFADAAAIQMAAGVTNACMGQLDAPVNIWHWKADSRPGAREIASVYPNMWDDGFHDDSGQAAAVFGQPEYAIPALAVGNQRALPDQQGKAENLIAGGNSTLTSKPDRPTAVTATWKEGKWAVIFTRPLTGENGDLTFAAGVPVQAAFAIWDGKQMQRDGMKYITDWAVLELK